MKDSELKEKEKQLKSLEEQMQIHKSYEQDMSVLKQELVKKEAEIE